MKPVRDNARYGLKWIDSRKVPQLKTIDLLLTTVVIVFIGEKIENERRGANQNRGYLRS